MSDKTKGQPGARWALLRRFTISKNGSLYLDRLRIVQTPWFGVYLHHIARPDLDRDPHDHPWAFGSLILRGGYNEDFHYAPRVHRDFLTLRRWNRWSWHTLDLSSAHRIRRVDPNTWTLVFVGKRVKDWGFWTEDGFVPWREYIAAADAETTAQGTSRTFPTVSEARDV